jgi:UDP-galactopyranose mutase
VDPRLKLVAILVLVALFVLVFELVRRRRLMERYALLWLVLAPLLLVVTLWDGLLESVARELGFAYAPSAMFALALAFVLVICLHFSMVISRLTNQNKVLAQELGSLESRLEALAQAPTAAEREASAAVLRGLAEPRRREGARPASGGVSGGAYDVLVVGAGFAGSVVAERLAERYGQRVLVVDRRPHIGGNAYDYFDDHGVLCHRYGPHIFHTQSAKVFEYLSGFTSWRPYEHRVLANVEGRLLPIPINRDTINALYGLRLRTDEEVEEFYRGRAEPIAFVANSEQAVVAKVGRDLYEKFFRGYTRKQWGFDASELAASVTSRIPVRANADDRYFGDRYQSMPAEGYTALFERLLDHRRIDVSLNCDFADVRREVAYRHLVYTGPIDAYFDHRFGPLPYRSIHFELRTVPTPDGGLVQPAATINFPGEDVPYTRSTEYRHLTGQRHRWSTIAIDHPTSEGDPYYPIPRPENREVYKRYEALAAKDPDVTFVGRLARYQYLNMDQVVAQALAGAERIAAAMNLQADEPADGIAGPVLALPDGRERRLG